MTERAASIEQDFLPPMRGSLYGICVRWIPSLSMISSIFAKSTLIQGTLAYFHKRSHRVTGQTRNEILGLGLREMSGCPFYLNSRKGVSSYGLFSSNTGYDV